MSPKKDIVPAFNEPEFEAVCSIGGKLAHRSSKPKPYIHHSNMARPSPYPGVVRVEGAGWWYRCTECGKDYPLDTLMDPEKADCCPEPEIHIWRNFADDPSRCST
jgi:DNA-directed RNA polymerase subunit RPC12/RpoP